MSTSEPPPAAPPGSEVLSWDDLPADLQGALDDRWRAAARAHGSLALPLPAFAADVLMLWARGRMRKGLATDVAALREDVDRLHYDDLYLARMCERGDDDAWRVLAARYEPDLKQVLRRHTAAAEADQVASAVLADVALPPARKPGRTMLGTYEGTGPLWAWLATIAVRTLRKGWGRREAPLEAAVEEMGTPPATPAPEEQTERFRAALRGAWEALEAREALALSYKHHHGCSQREIARLLDTSAPTVTRIVQRALAKVRGHLELVAVDLLEADAETWTRLAHVLSSHFETLDTPQHRDMDAS